MGEKVDNAEKKLSETKIWASEVEEEFQEQKKCVDVFSKNNVHSTLKVSEVSSHLALTC